MRSDDSIRLKEEELQNLSTNNHLLMEKNKQLTQQNKELQQNIGSLTYQVDALEKQIKRDSQLFEEFKTLKDNQLPIETKLKQQLEKETRVMFDKIARLEDQQFKHKMKSMNMKIEKQMKKLAS